MRLLLLLCCFSFIILSESVMQGQSMANTLTQILAIMQDQRTQGEECEAAKTRMDTTDTRLEKTREELEQMKTKLGIVEAAMDKDDFEEAVKTRLGIVEAAVGALQGDGSLLHHVLQNAIQTRELHQEIQKMKDQHSEDKTLITDVVEKSGDMEETFSGIKDTMKELRQFVVTVTDTVKSLKTGNSDDLKELKEFVTTVTETVKSLTKGCPQHFVRWESGCYYFSTSRKSYSDALADCKIRTGGSGDLISIETELESAFITEQLTKIGAGQHYWTSLQCVSGVCRWNGAQSGPGLQYTHWHSGQPSSSSRCVFIHVNAPWKWHSYSCSYSTRYICESLY